MLNGSWYWTDAVCYVGQRGGQGGSNRAEVSGRHPVDPVAGNDDDDDDNWDDVGGCTVVGTIFPLFKLTSPSVFLLFVCIFFAPLLLSMGESNSSGQPPGSIYFKDIIFSPWW